MNLHPLPDPLGNWDDWFLPPVLCAEWPRLQLLVDLPLKDTNADPTPSQTYILARRRMSKSVLETFNVNAVQARTLGDIKPYEIAYAQTQVCAALVEEFIARNVPCLYELAWVCAFTTTGTRHANWEAERAILEYNIIALGIQIYFLRLRVHQPSVVIELGSPEQKSLTASSHLRDMHSYVHLYQQRSNVDPQTSVLRSLGVLPDSSVFEVVQNLMMTSIAHWLLLHGFIPCTLDKDIRKRCFRWDDTMETAHCFDKKALLNCIGLSELGFRHADRAVELISQQTQQHLYLRKSEYATMLKYAIQCAFVFNLLRHALLAKYYTEFDIGHAGAALGCSDVLKKLLNCPTAQLLRNEKPTPVENTPTNPPQLNTLNNVADTTLPAIIMQQNWSVNILKVQCLAELSELEITTVMGWAQSELAELDSSRSVVFAGVTAVAPTFSAPNLQPIRLPHIVEVPAQQIAQSICSRLARG